ncbi:MAG TPA: pyridoxamine 5'-phosphate oxidase family protein [Anaerolineales bacterium]|nr:pyridoxamine 5'-phosphate oxidase family protein [Anaerolineales bacterium]
MELSQTAFSAEDIQSTRPELKIGLLATVTPEGLPHVTLLSSLMACAPGRLCFGQFTEGLSKKHLLANPKTGFLIMSLDKNVWRGKASYTHAVKDGAEYDYYNNVPMFRYNAYFGVHTVYYLDLVGHTGKSPLPMNRIIFAAVQTMLARTLNPGSGRLPVLNTWTRAFVAKIDNLKFLSYVDADGYPVIIPAIQTQGLDRQRLVFSTSVYTDELRAIPSGTPLAVFSMALTMEDVLLRGTFQGIRRMAGIDAGVVSVDWVYNPMPPVPGQVYPALDLEPVSSF